MKRVEFLVLHENGAWRVQGGKEAATSHPSEADALEAAIYNANALGRAGYEARVLKRGLHGHWRTHWTFGEDALPS